MQGQGMSRALLVVLIVTKSFRPGEVWGKFRVNCARMSEITLELRPEINFPSGKDCQGLEAAFSSFPLVHGARPQPWLPANILSKCLPAVIGTRKIMGFVVFTMPWVPLFG